MDPLDYLVDPLDHQVDPLDYLVDSLDYLVDSLDRYWLPVSSSSLSRYSSRGNWYASR